jgi:hypothetical protein
VIVSTNFLGGMLKATDKAIPEIGDSDLNVPAALLPTIETILPLDILAVSNSSPGASFFTEATINKTADLAGSQVLCTFDHGLWTLDLNADFVIVGTGAIFNPNHWSINLDYQGYSIPLIGANSYNATLYHNSMNRKVRMLLRDNGVTLTLFWKATGAAERIGVYTSILATKHL